MSYNPLEIRDMDWDPLETGRSSVGWDPLEAGRSSVGWDTLEAGGVG